MRRLALAALLSLAAACSVKTEGAACTADGNCPSGQACGHDGKCSKEAVGCGGNVCRKHACSGSTLRQCVVQPGTVCASTVEVACSAHQDCDDAQGQCTCKPNRCQAGAGAAICDSASGNLVTCQQEAGTGCWYEAASAPCADPGQACSAGACVCPGNRCQSSGGAPVCDGTSLVACQQVAGSACWSEQVPAACADVGQACSGGACACVGTPGTAAGELCAVVGEASCAAGKLLRCALVPGSAACSKWVEDDCAAAGLQCDAGAAACVCPGHGSGTFVAAADPTAPRRAGLTVNGAAMPAVCRYASLAEAMAAVTSGDVVMAIGYASTPVVFTEGALTVKAGVTLTTGDSPLTTTHYIIEPAPSVGSSPFISLAPGATLSGFEIRNVGASGPGVATSCAGASDTATASLSSVQVTALGSGASPPRFATGLHHGGNCSLNVADSTFLGAADGGVVIDSAAATTSLTFLRNTIHNNLATTLYTIGATDRRAGGMVFKGASLPGTVAFRGNQVLSNEGDQILAFASGALDLSAAACGTPSDENVVACYTTGVGVAARATIVNVAHTSWQNEIPAASTDFVAGGGGQVNGTTQACSAFAGPCP